MTTQLFKSDTRGKADFGWLKANFSFSFGNYHNPERVQFGMLRVLNDDTIAGGTGFGTHGHANMEIITIPLEGGLMHKDSMGNEGVIRFGEVQVMSAGTGVEHSEMNASQKDNAKTLQLWVFPDKEEVTPRYDQKSFDIENQINTFVNIVSPKDSNDGNALWVYQKTFFYLGIFDSNTTTTYEVKIPQNGVYLFLIEGEIEVNNQILKARDAMGITDFDQFEIKIITQSKILLVEVPMNHS
ncbi:pirin family protein [Flavobacterium sp. AED]|jgi:redox-sensitive bicupin YhaK (pirin superfamily)|uniref:pirin family protein n=1 Tax=Flavobacterium sp. AED TaxID=1423323 RepID=UPI00057FEB3B|nr:pirin family protein [Flavobacterium sp. AED]KIA87629.1 pirin [Flavobacterium sp. AED]MDI1303683.1 pirin family protein [bacterium]